MNTDVEFHIRQNYPWLKLPANLKQSLGNSQREYEKAVIVFSIKNQLRFKSHLVKSVYKKDERIYYEELLKYSKDHLMLYPYHLSDVMVKGLRITPFSYYTDVMNSIMNQEKSYDSLPNFTAADCLRLMGIGRNQYIDLMNQCRSSKKFFRKKPPKELLPLQPIEGITLEPWWIAHIGYITEDDVKACNAGEKHLVDQIIDCKQPLLCAHMSIETLLSLYRKGLVYVEVPISDDDCIIVPPLEGFVMNRVLGDYFETLLYKIFVSIDEHTTVAELANVLEIDLDLVKNAVSMYCRLGFAKKKNIELNQDNLDPSWVQQSPVVNSKKPTPDQLLIDWTSVINEQNDSNTSPETSSIEGDRAIEPTYLMNAGHSKRIAFMFDSTLTAFLMMGNLSPGLKSHAVTMFEVGKLSDESLDSFLTELEKVNTDAEGEAQRYFDHAVTLRNTIRFLRYNKNLCTEDGLETTGQGIDLLRCESLLGLDPATCSRVLHKNYSLLISMAPLSNEIRPISSCTPQHIGPAVPEVNSVWFKLFIYHMTGCGPPTLLLVKGTKLRKLPKAFQDYDKLLITTWGHDPGVIPTSNILLTLNDALSHSAVLIQAHGWHQQEGEVHHIPFPFSTEKSIDSTQRDFQQHLAVEKLDKVLDLEHSCGFITLLKTGKTYSYNPNPNNIHSNSITAVQTQQQQPPSSNCDNIFLKDSTNSHIKATEELKRGYTPETPSNGIKDPVSAEMLESELDLLDGKLKKADSSSNKVVVSSKQNTGSSSSSHKELPPQETTKLTADRTKLKLHLGEIESGLDSTSLESNWLLLDCYYGIPLFDANLNQLVCDKISEKGLCDKNCLQELLHSSRTLSLRLLSFIAENQDLPVIQEHSHESGMIPNAGLNIQQTVPFPTHNIIFEDGCLLHWNGN